MKIDRGNVYRVSIIVTFVIIGSLSMLLFWRYWPRQPVLISREEAIQQAIKACNHAYGLQPVEPPTEFKIEMTTYEDALGVGSITHEAESPVYVVKMKKGKWILVGGPAPEIVSDPSQPTPEPHYWEECTQVIDAQTGEGLSLPIE